MSDEGSNIVSSDEGSNIVSSDEGSMSSDEGSNVVMSSDKGSEVSGRKRGDVKLKKSMFCWLLVKGRKWSRHWLEPFRL